MGSSVSRALVPRLPSTEDTASCRQPGQGLPAAPSSAALPPAALEPYRGDALWTALPGDVNRQIVALLRDAPKTLAALAQVSRAGRQAADALFAAEAAASGGSLSPAQARRLHGETRLAAANLAQATPGGACRATPRVSRWPLLGQNDDDPLPQNHGLAVCPGGRLCVRPVIDEEGCGTTLEVTDLLDSAVSYRHRFAAYVYQSWWSPDGLRLAVAAWNHPDRWRVFFFDATGEDAPGAAIVDANAQPHCTWSPNSAALLVRTYKTEPHPEVWSWVAWHSPRVVRPLVLPQPGLDEFELGFLTFSPDGRALLASWGDKVSLFDVSGAAPPPLEHGLSTILEVPGRLGTWIGPTRASMLRGNMKTLEVELEPELDVSLGPAAPHGLAYEEAWGALVDPSSRYVAILGEPRSVVFGDRTHRSHVCVPLPGWPRRAVGGYDRLAAWAPPTAPAPLFAAVTKVGRNNAKVVAIDPEAGGVIGILVCPTANVHIKWAADGRHLLCQSDSEDEREDGSLIDFHLDLWRPVDDQIVWSYRLRDTYFPSPPMAQIIEPLRGVLLPTTRGHVHIDFTHDGPEVES